MTANALSKIFLKWYQENNPDARIFRNNSGAVKTQFGMVRYGLPNKGGADWIALVPVSYIDYDIIDDNLIKKTLLRVDFYEIKTKNDKLSKDQIKFANMVFDMGGRYFIVNENTIENYERCKEKNILTSFYFMNEEFYIKEWNRIKQGSEIL
jgi:hypothetical protein